MTAPTEDLIARLERKGYTRAMCDTQESINPDGPEAAQALRALQQEVERLNRLVDLWVPKTTCPTGHIGSSVKEYRTLIKAVNAATDDEIARSALTGSAQG